jgi:opacity protein-like surface antigen
MCAMTVAMPRTIVSAVTLAAAGLLGTCAARADNADTVTPYVTPSGAYAGVGWGHFDLRLDNLDDVGEAVNSIVHSGDDAFKADLGYRFSPYFALEGDYMNLGTPSDGFQGVGANGNYRLHLSGFAPFAVATLPLGPLELFGKAGWLYYNSDLRVNLNAPGQQLLESSHSRSDFIWGGGIGATFFRHLNVSAEYDGLRLENARNSDALWLNVGWRF